MHNKELFVKWLKENTNYVFYQDTITHNNEEVWIYPDLEKKDINGILYVSNNGVSFESKNNNSYTFSFNEFVECVKNNYILYNINILI